MHHRDAVAAALLAGGDRDLLPVALARRGALALRPRHGAGGEHRPDLGDAELHGLAEGELHAFAGRNALISYNGTGRKSKSLAVELLLYVSCQRQISKAIELLGVNKRDKRIALTALSESKDALEKLAKVGKSKIDGSLNDDVIEIRSEKKAIELRKVYGITSKESEASRFAGETESELLKRLVIERSALVAIDR